jgi:hypothetical protein
MAFSLMPKIQPSAMRGERRDTGGDRWRGAPEDSGRLAAVELWNYFWQELFRNCRQQKPAGNRWNLSLSFQTTTAHKLFYTTDS